jgi:hypothetical protein
MLCPEPKTAAATVPELPQPYLAALLCLSPGRERWLALLSLSAWQPMWLLPVERLSELRPWISPLQVAGSPQGGLPLSVAPRLRASLLPGLRLWPALERESLSWAELFEFARRPRC